MGYSIWLQFCERGEKLLQNKIQEIADECASPVFKPHLTLVGDIEVDPSTIRQQMELLAQKIVQFDMPVRDIGASDSFFMALYLSVEIPRALLNMRIEVARKLKVDLCNIDTPHVSLAYGDSRQRRALKQQIMLAQDLRGAILRAKGISLVHSSKDVPIQQWKIIETLAFQ
ncbi:2'-5' RNA ligase family protein [Paracoccus seriniphilus]|uniref:Cyclic phosphodiesterase-like protein n=1 Tax=Paracoccus seriniphilus TaxID=184748 RepID=A0A239Q1Y5_9RHOB|nr:hypothetical protein [Paracoccus seriniphilus]WCR16117.1 hypothetical protein JHW44_16855 [Paracoccus seriniphilus]SNT76266.1 Cyclic phosphodiesterase-like protein [Paracoccus seriniphilus]